MTGNDSKWYRDMATLYLRAAEEARTDQAAMANRAAADKYNGIAQRLEASK